MLQKDERINNILHICKYSGILFMAVCTVLFYNSLFTAYGNPGFFTWIYFDAFGEGFLELMIFLLLAPFIIFAIVLESINIYKLTTQESKVVEDEVFSKGPTG